MEINRLEADKHLIGVGRELESLDGKAKATLPVHVTKDGLRFTVPLSSWICLRSSIS